MSPAQELRELSITLMKPHTRSAVAASTTGRMLAEDGESIAFSLPRIIIMTTHSTYTGASEFLFEIKVLIVSEQRTQTGRGAVKQRARERAREAEISDFGNL